METYQRNNSYTKRVCKYFEKAIEESKAVQCRIGSRKSKLFISCYFTKMSYLKTIENSKRCEEILDVFNLVLAKKQADVEVRTHFS